MDGKPLNVLLVEDSPIDAELVERTLRRGGIAFTSRRVETEAALREALTGSTPDVILADYRLPAFDGMEALRVARELAPRVPFIFVSGSLGEERAVQALHEGATDYVTKDRPARLPEAVRRAIRERDDDAARAATEAALAESQRRLHLALQATRDVIWDVDLRSGTSYVSRAIHEGWGIDPPPASFEEWVERVHPDDRERLQRRVAEWHASSDDRMTNEYRIRRGDGTYRLALSRALMLRDSSGAPVRIVGAIQDVTESRRLQEQLERASRVDSLGRVAMTVAHEFKNVLMSIQPYAEKLRRDGDEQIAAIAEKIIGAVGRGRAMVDEIQQVTRVAEPKRQTFDLGAWLPTLRPELSAIAGTARVIMHTPDEPLAVRCDQAQLQQVIANLVTNARDAIGPEGTIEITAAAAEGSAILSVSDDGHGMPDDVAAHIFEPLFTTKSHGTGLGLAVSQRIVTQNGGTIAVETAVGRGTTFRIALPLDSAQAPHRAAATARAPRRLLIVEDDAAVADGLTLLLEGEGIECDNVGRGADAVQAADAMRPDVVLLDVTLPDVHGTEVFDRLRERWPELPIVFASGHADEERVESRAAAPGVALLRKPFAIRELLEVLEKIA